MYTTIIISIITCILLIISVLFFPKIKFRNYAFSTYWFVCLIGALCIIIFGCISVDEVFKGLFSNSNLNPIKILVLFFSMTFLSVFLDEVGFFKYLATLLVSKVKTNQITIFVSLYLLISLLTVFTSNDIVVLTFTPFICYFCKNVKINPISYLVAMFTASNTWSMMLIIGNPTNIYLASSYNISFIEYFKVMALPTLFAGLCQLVLLLLLFKKQLNKKITVNEKLCPINHKLDLVFGLFHLGLCLILLAISSYINLQMWMICLICALSLFGSIFTIHLIRHQKIKILLQTIQRLPYELIIFVLSMFIIVLALKKQGVNEIISSFLGKKHIILRYGLASYLFSNLINNIPMSVLFSTIYNMSSYIDNLKAIYSTIIGSNIGAFLTPIGALAGMMFSELVNKANIDFSFKTFIKYGFIISSITLIVALLTLSLVI